MNLSFEEIFIQSEVGKANSIKPNLNASTSTNDNKKKESVLIGIDFQNDFMEFGNLAVPNSHKDVFNFAKFIHKNADKIDDIVMSLDIHQPKQIFHPCWWMNENGIHPKPFETVITYSDVINGRWKPLYQEKESIEYLLGLEKEGKKSLIIWDYHCLQGTFGSAIETQLTNILFAYSLYKKQDVTYISKGLNPISEMYGIVKPEFSKVDSTNYHLLKQLSAYKNIIIGGEAKSHCVLESIKQIAEGFNQMNHSDYTIYVLEDCMSSITGFENSTEKEYDDLTKKYNITLTNTIDLF